MNKLILLRKKHGEKIEALRHEYELKLHHASNINKNYLEMQNRLNETETQLDRSLAQIAQMERFQKSQV